MSSSNQFGAERDQLSIANYDGVASASGMVFQDFIIRCPSCQRPNKLSFVAAYSGSYLTAWTDGWISPSLEPPPVLRCCHCAHIADRDSFEKQGPVKSPLVRCRLDLIEVGPARVGVMKVVRSTSTLSLGETKDLLRNLPAPLLTDAAPWEASEVQKRFQSVGAITSITEWQEDEGSPKEWLDSPYAVGVKDARELLGFLDSHADIPQLTELLIRRYLFWVWNHSYRCETIDWIPVSGREVNQILNANRLFFLATASPHLHDILLAGEIAREMADYSTSISIFSGTQPGECDAAANYLLQLAKLGISALQVMALGA